jgi:hypothetical protein
MKIHAFGFNVALLVEQVASDAPRSCGSANTACLHGVTRPRSASAHKLPLAGPTIERRRSEAVKECRMPGLRVGPRQRKERRRRVFATQCSEEARRRDGDGPAR